YRDHSSQRRAPVLSPNANIRRMIAQSIAALRKAGGLPLAEKDEDDAGLDNQREPDGKFRSLPEGEGEGDESGAQLDEERRPRRRRDGDGDGEAGERTVEKQGPEEEIILAEYDEELAELVEDALDGEIDEESFAEELTALA